MAKAEFKEFSLYNGEVKVKFYPNSHMYKVTDEKNGLKDQRVKGVTTFLGIKDKSAALVSWATETAGLHLYDIISSGNPVTMPDVVEAIGKHRQIKEEAATTGTIAHEWCEYFIKHKLGEEGYEKEPVLPTDPAQLLAVDSFLEWYNAHDVKFLSSERVVYSRQYQYIGTMDFEAIVDGVLSVGDFKTSNGLYNTVLAQTAAYQHAIEEEGIFTGQKAVYENRYAVRLSKEGPEEYAIRMERKNYIKGREGNGFEPHNPFEWKKIEGREAFKRDFNGFLAARELFLWDEATDFYKNK